ncbi:MAG: SAM-dependent chlorinase/fluorinase [Solobacterium sp.]|nr:SAM-dependent chlorinase/fluorinase [Solobacterium sp.]
MKPAVVIQSDCGYPSTLFARTAGVIESLSPHTQISAESLGMEKNNIRMVSAYLFTCVPFWPDGTIFLTLLGEGKSVAVRLSSGSILISPDNGICTMCAASFGLDEARHIRNDIFGNDEYAMARCAAGLVSGMAFEDIGPKAGSEEICLFSVPASHVEEGLAVGEVGMLLKTFGNITFSIGTDEFETTGIHTGDTVLVTFTHDDQIVYQEEMTYQASFGYVEEGEPLIFNGSSGYMDIGLNRDNFIMKCLPEILDVQDPGEYKVRIEKR